MPAEPRCRTKRSNERSLYTVFPWCEREMERCISWIAAWGELVRHCGADHRDVQELFKASSALSASSR
jgi:hypothetical protein